MKMQSASTTPSKYYQLRNGNTVQLESKNITTREIDDRESKVIAFFVNAVKKEK